MKRAGEGSSSVALSTRSPNRWPGASVLQGQPPHRRSPPARPECGTGVLGAFGAPAFCSSEQLHNDVSGAGCAAAGLPLLLQSASAAAENINKPITPSARLGLIYVDLG